MLQSRWPIISTLANVCQMSDLVCELEGQEWRDKAAIYRQHAVKLARRMGWKVPLTCGYCNKPTNYKEATDVSMTHIVLNSCGHMHHAMCQARAKHRGVTKYATCQQLGYDQHRDMFPHVPGDYSFD